MNLYIRVFNLLWMKRMWFFIKSWKCSYCPKIPGKGGVEYNYNIKYRWPRNRPAGLVVQPCFQTRNPHVISLLLMLSEMFDVTPVEEKWENSALFMHARETHSDNFSLENFEVSIVKESSPQNIRWEEFWSIGKFRTIQIGLNRYKASNLICVDC